MSLFHIVIYNFVIALPNVQFLNNFILYIYTFCRFSISQPKNVIIDTKYLIFHIVIVIYF